MSYDKGMNQTALTDAAFAALLGVSEAELPTADALAPEAQPLPAVEVYASLTELLGA